jgi:dolichol-phosphate mannosyltransferase
MLTINTSVVIPVFNEGKLIVETLKNIHYSLVSNYEILICYDFDEDDTLKEINSSKILNNQKRYIKFVKNNIGGPHAAVMKGLRTSLGSYVIVIPADDSINSKNVHKLIELALTGYDIVCPSRFIKHGRMKGAPILKAIINRFVNYTLYLSGIPSSDATNGFRLFSKKILNDIEIRSKYGFTYSLEYLIKAYDKNYKIEEYPSVWIERNIGKSRFTLTKWWKAYLKLYMYGIYIGLKKRVAFGK